MLGKDLQYILDRRHSLEYDWQLSTSHLFHNWLQGMDLHISGFDMPCQMDIQHLWYIPVCKQHRDLQNILVCIGRQLLYLLLDSWHCFHKGKDYKGQLPLAGGVGLKLLLSKLTTDYYWNLKLQSLTVHLQFITQPSYLCPTYVLL